MQVYIYFLGSTFQHKHYCFLCGFPDISYQAGNVCAFFFTFLHVKSFIIKKPHILTYEQKVKIWYQQNCFKAPISFTTGRVRWHSCFSFLCGFVVVYSSDFYVQSCWMPCCCVWYFLFSRVITSSVKSELVGLFFVVYLHTVCLLFVVVSLVEYGRGIIIFFANL